MTTEILWLSPTDFVTGDDSLRINYPSVTHPAVEIKATAPGDLKWVSLGLKIPPFHEINAIHVCYQLSNSRSFISQVRLAEMRTPDQALVRHDDGTDLLSTAPACYRSQLVTSYRPGGAVLLELRLNFGNVADTITLGAIGVELLPCAPVPSYTRSTLPAPGAPGCLARVTDSVRGLWMDQGSQWFSLSGEVANVKEFGAKGDGITDDQCAFAAAIASLSPSNSSKGGVVLVPPGIYRFCNTLHIKKSIVIRGATGSPHRGCVIKPDMGITPFVIERYNTPDLIPRIQQQGDWTVIERLAITPAEKTPAWVSNTPYAVGERVKVGRGNGENWAKHYECVTTGTSAGSGSGPRGFGTALFAHVAVVTNELYVIGRSAPDPGDGSINYKYDPVDDSWIPGTNPPLNGRRYMGCAVFNDKVYVFGGEDQSGAQLADVAMYDPVNNTWAPKTPMREARAGLAAAVVNGKIYAIGGYKGETVFNIVEEYDPVNNSWTTKTSMRIARAGLAAAVVNDKIYAIGGYEGGRVFATRVFDTVEEYDPSTNTWALRRPMPTPRARFAAAVVNNKIWAIGGLSREVFSDFYPTVEEYDPVTDGWTTKTPMPTVRGGIVGIAAGVVRGVLYVVGGDWTVGACDLATETWTIKVPTIVDNIVRWKYLGGGHGIKLRARATIRDVTIDSCSGNGVHIEAQDPELIAAQANANAWRLDNVLVFSCDGHGYYINGSDTNGGLAVGGDLTGNGLLPNGRSAGNYAIYESSFLGNTFVGCSMEANGNAVFAASIGGSSVFLGCYLEGGDGNGILWEPGGSSMIIGGGLTDGRYLSPTMNPLVIKQHGRHCRGFAFEAKAPSGPDGVATIGSSISGGGEEFATVQAGMDYPTSLYLSHRFGNFGNCTDVYGWTHGNNDRTGLMTAGGHTILKSWPMQPPLGRALFEEFYVGQSRHATSASTADPTSGTWNPGDRIYFIGTACQAGGAEGKVCVKAGTAGTFTDTVTVTDINNNTNTVTLSAVPAGSERGDKSLRVGMIVTINGAPRRIIAMADNFRSMTMDGPIAGGVPATIGYTAPVFKGFGSIAP